MPVIPVLWEAKEGESQGQEFKTNLVNMEKPMCGFWHITLQPRTPELKTLRCLESKTRNLIWDF